MFPLPLSPQILRPLQWSWPLPLNTVKEDFSVIQREARASSDSSSVTWTLPCSFLLGSFPWKEQPTPSSCLLFYVLVVQSPSHVQLLVTPWTAALQASLSLTISQSLLKFMSIESVMPSNRLILCALFFFCPQSFPA